MKKIFFMLTAGVFMLASCQQSATKEAVKHQQLSQQAIAVHDDIMPQLSIFERTTLRIDSILGKLDQALIKDPSLDTVKVAADLNALKTNLNAATDHMMSWMHAYVPDSTDVKYQEEELKKVKLMKKQFEDVSLESNTKMAAF
ncbi:transposase [Sphingobacterium sp. Mn56C]|uniref:transposase n=1 Tax=Sphingobacterium sp. Mn56C TaxID=3395261 RepID=UPI003BD04C24